MAVDIRATGCKLVWQAEGLEIDLLPLQGYWTEEQYLRLTDQTNHFIEFTEGDVEVLPMPTRKYQAISRFLFLAFWPLCNLSVALYSTRRYVFVSRQVASMSRT
jgi:hypothetical protein